MRARYARSFVNNPLYVDFRPELRPVYDSRYDGYVYGVVLNVRCIGAALIGVAEEDVAAAPDAKAGAAAVAMVGVAVADTAVADVAPVEVVAAFAVAAPREVPAAVWACGCCGG